MAVIASFNSASTSAFFCALTSSRAVRLLLLESKPILSTDDFRSRSLVSRLKPGMLADVADLKSAIALLGPLDTLRRDCSLNNAFSMFFVAGLEGRFAAAPGLVSDLLVDTEDEGFALGWGGAIITGPPSLRLIESHISGSRAAKLANISKETTGEATQTYNGITISVQKSLRGSEEAFWAGSPPEGVVT